MALLCSRLVGRNVRNQFAFANRFYAAGKDAPAADDIVTGIERAELEQIAAGNEDPFRMRALKRMPSTKSNPNLVPSYYDCRIVGCVCEEDSASIVWMWLFKGEPRRCQCGHWFKLTEYKF